MCREENNVKNLIPIKFEAEVNEISGAKSPDKAVKLAHCLCSQTGRCNCMPEDIVSVIEGLSEEAPQIDADIPSFDLARIVSNGIAVSKGWDPDELSLEWTISTTLFAEILRQCKGKLPRFQGKISYGGIDYSKLKMTSGMNFRETMTECLSDWLEMSGGEMVRSEGGKLNFHHDAFTEGRSMLAWVVMTCFATDWVSEPKRDYCSWYCGAPAHLVMRTILRTESSLRCSTNALNQYEEGTGVSGSPPPTFPMTSFTDSELPPQGLDEATKCEDWWEVRNKYMEKWKQYRKHRGEINSTFVDKINSTRFANEHRLMLAKVKTLHAEFNRPLQTEAALRERYERDQETNNDIPLPQLGCWDLTGICITVMIETGFFCLAYENILDRDRDCEYVWPWGQSEVPELGLSPRLRWMVNAYACDIICAWADLDLEYKNRNAPGGGDGKDQVNSMNSREDMVGLNCKDHTASSGEDGTDQVISTSSQDMVGLNYEDHTASSGEDGKDQVISTSSQDMVGLKYEDHTASSGEDGKDHVISTSSQDMVGTTYEDHTASSGEDGKDQVISTNSHEDIIDDEHLNTNPYFPNLPVALCGEHLGFKSLEKVMYRMIKKHNLNKNGTLKPYRFPLPVSFTTTDDDGPVLTRVYEPLPAAHIIPSDPDALVRLQIQNSKLKDALEKAVNSFKSSSADLNTIRSLNTAVYKLKSDLDLSKAEQAKKMEDVAGEHLRNLSSMRKRVAEMSAAASEKERELSTMRSTVANLTTDRDDHRANYMRSSKEARRAREEEALTRSSLLKLEGKFSRMEQALTRAADAAKQDKVDAQLKLQMRIRTLEGENSAFRAMIPGLPPPPPGGGGAGRWRISTATGTSPWQTSAGSGRSPGPPAVPGGLRARYRTARTYRSRGGGGTGWRS